MYFCPIHLISDINGFCAEIPYPKITFRVFSSFMLFPRYHGANNQFRRSRCNRA
jgi:hypothetical protein